MGVSVDVDKAGSDVVPADINDLAGFRFSDIFRYGGNLLASGGDIHGFTDVVGRVDDVAAFQQDVVWHGLSPRRRAKNYEECD